MCNVHVDKMLLWVLDMFWRPEILLDKNNNI